MKSLESGITDPLPPAITVHAASEPGTRVHRPNGKSKLRRSVAAVGLSTFLVALSAGFASASSPNPVVQAASNQDTILQPGEGNQFGTWFWGRTVVCFTNLGSEVASYEWISSTTFSSRSLTPHEQHCDSRSFVGFGIYVTNTSVTNSPIQVSLPYGP